MGSFAEVGWRRVELDVGCAMCFIFTAIYVHNFACVML